MREKRPEQARTHLAPCLEQIEEVRASGEEAADAHTEKTCLRDTSTIELRINSHSAFTWSWGDAES